MDQVLGNDRVNTSPSLAVDNSRGPRRGTVYLVYANNNSGDGADIVFQRSTDGGQTFSAPLEINAAPGEDRPQWFPWVTVDIVTGRVHVFYYDQGIDTSGDLTEVSYTFSDDGGRHWSAPVPLTKRPFHAGLGQRHRAAESRRLQPGSLAARRAVRGVCGGVAAAGGLRRRPADRPQLTVPDIEFKRSAVRSKLDLNSLPLSIDVNGVTVEDSSGNGNGFLDPGETVRVRLPLTNYTVNPLNDATGASVIAVLVVGYAGRAGTPAARHVRAHRRPARLRPSVAQVPAATVAELRSGHADRAEARSRSDVRRRWPGSRRRCVTRCSPARRWRRRCSARTSTRRAGRVARRLDVLARRRRELVPWVTSNTFCGTSNAAFHQNAERQRRRRSDALGAAVQPEVRDACGLGLRDAGVRCLHRHRVRSELPHPGVRRPDAAHLRSDAGPHPAIGARRSVRG